MDEMNASEVLRDETRKATIMEILLIIKESDNKEEVERKIKELLQK